MARLSRERIIEAVFRLLDEEGWEALSMRRLAQELDVWPMAVYRYFHDKDELVDAMIAAVIEEIDVPPLRGPWRTQLRALLEVVRSALEQLPPELRGRLAPALLSPDTPRLSDVGVGVLESAGFDREDAQGSWATVAAYTVGFVEVAPAVTDAARFDRGLDHILDGLERSLPPRKPRAGARRRRRAADPTAPH